MPQQLLKEKFRSKIDLVAQINELSAEVQDLNTINKLFSNVINKDNLETVYKEILDVAVSMSSAEKGSIQIYNVEQEMLTMILGLGLSQKFMTDFHNTNLDVGTCGLSVKEKKRIYAEDIRKFPVYIGKPIVECFLKEDIHGEQSIPLISSTGKIVGVLNTYHDKNKKFNERELRMLNILSRIAADIIEHNKIELSLQESEKKALSLIEELKEEDKNKTILIDSLSHELRNPLATIVAAVSLMNITDDKNKILKSKVIIDHQVKQLCHLVDDMLDLTRINNSKIRLKLKTLDLKKLVITATKDYETLFNEKGITYNVEVSEARYFASVDPVKINQIIQNLLNNALKFTEKGGAVTLQLKRINDNAIILVKDTGIGIKSEFLPFIFEPFKQAENSIDNPNCGLGLGLAIVKGIVEQHGGTVCVESQGLGKGTQFFIKLPLIMQKISDKPKDTISTNSKSVKFVVIDDNRGLAEMICSFLELSGYVGFTAFNGVEGLHLVQEVHPDVVICDIGLPNMNGYEVARNIRINKEIKNTYLIALSAYAKPQDIEYSIKSGFDHHIAKPINFQHLCNIIEYKI